MRRKFLVSIVCIFLILFFTYYMIKLGIEMVEVHTKHSVSGGQYDKVFIQYFSQMISVVIIICCTLTIETFYLLKGKNFIKTDSHFLNKLADLEIPFSCLAICIELLLLLMMKYFSIPNSVSILLLIIHGGIAIYPGCFFIINIIGRSSEK